MAVEELLALLKEKGMGDEDIEVLLADAIKAIHPEEEPHDEVVAENEEDEKSKAAELLGVEL